MIINDKELFDLIAEVGDFEEGGRIKHDMVECEITLELTDKVLASYGESLKPLLAKHFPDVENPLEELKNVVFTIYGYTTYDDGFDSYDDDIHVSVKTDNHLLAYFKAMVKKYNLLNEPILLAVNKDELAANSKHFLDMLSELSPGYKDF